MLCGAMNETNETRRMSDRELLLWVLREVRGLRREIRRMASEEQADFTALEDTVTGLENDEHEVATEFGDLAEQIKSLTEGHVTAAQINELNAKAVALGEKLKADVAAAGGGPTPTPTPEPPPAENA